MLSLEFCSGRAQIVVMHYRDKNLEIKLVIDFACFAFVAREKYRLQSFKHTVLRSFPLLVLCGFLYHRNLPYDATQFTSCVWLVNVGRILLARHLSPPTTIISEN